MNDERCFFMNEVFGEHRVIIMPKDVQFTILPLGVLEGAQTRSTDNHPSPCSEGTLPDASDQAHQSQACPDSQSSKPPSPSYKSGKSSTDTTDRELTDR